VPSGISSGNLTVTYAGVTTSALAYTVIGSNPTVTSYTPTTVAPTGTMYRLLRRLRSRSCASSSTNCCWSQG
jgi:hypothetical protein